VLIFFLGSTCLLGLQRHRALFPNLMLNLNIELLPVATATTLPNFVGFAIYFELGLPLHSLSKLFCNNISTLHMATNPVFHARTPHIEIDYHFNRELLARGALRAHYVPSDQQLANIYMKGLTRKRFNFLWSNLKLQYVPSRLRRRERKDIWQPSISRHILPTIS